MEKKAEMAHAVEDTVRAQYEAYPYPEYDPDEEARGLRAGSPSHLKEINHYIFSGNRDFSKPFRALIAGGGTGKSTVMLAQQLADVGCPAEIIYIDLSQASREIAEVRVRDQRLSNVTFRNLSILDLPSAGMGLFDYIDCCGVLHHLDNPAEGLKVLASVLADDGGMGLMLYGELGRTGVYPVQEMMRMISLNDSPAEKVALTRRLLAQLPPTNWLRRNPIITDHIDAGDAGLFDLLLHSRDRAYRVPEIAQLVESADLRLTTFMLPAAYDPASYLNDRVLARMSEGLDWVDRCAFAENLFGNLPKHVLYVVKGSNPGPCVIAPSDDQAIPVFRNQDVIESVARVGSAQGYGVKIYGMPFQFPMPPLATAILKRIDGVQRVADIRSELQKINPGLSNESFTRQFMQVFDALNSVGNLFLTRTPLACSY